MEKIIEKAKVLIEALPYMHEFSGKTFVIKYGGSAMENEEAKINTVLDIIFLKKMGINPVLVHGGGKKITEMMNKMGKKSTFVHGFRVTDKDTIDIVEMVLVGNINKELVNLINVNGGNAVGISGKDGQCIRAHKHIIKNKNKIIDIGYVGEIDNVDSTLINILSSNGFIPVISSIGFGDKAETFNINADTAAGAIAGALKAAKLILLTDVDGILDKEKNLIPSVNIKMAQKLMKNNTITEGMHPKVEACFTALKTGVSKTHIINAGLSHALLLEIFTKKGIGTEVTM